jgi:hypothetical protein
MLSESHPQVLRLQYEKELSQAHVTVQTKFNYAWGLVKSPIRDHQVEGVRLLQGKYIYTPLYLTSSFDIMLQRFSGRNQRGGGNVYTISL